MVLVRFLVLADLRPGGSAPDFEACLCSSAIATVVLLLLLACAPSPVAAADRVAADAAVRADVRRVLPLMPAEPIGSVATSPAAGGNDAAAVAAGAFLERRDLIATVSKNCSGGCLSQVASTNAV